MALPLNTFSLWDLEEAIEVEVAEIHTYPSSAQASFVLGRELHGAHHLKVESQ